MYNFGKIEPGYKVIVSFGSTGEWLAAIIKKHSDAEWVVRYEDGRVGIVDHSQLRPAKEPKEREDQQAEIARRQAALDDIAEMVQPGLADLHGDWAAVEGLLENIAMLCKKGGE